MLEALHLACSIECPAVVSWAASTETNTGIVVETETLAEIDVAALEIEIGIEIGIGTEVEIGIGIEIGIEGVRDSTQTTKTTTTDRTGDEARIGRVAPVEAEPRTGTAKMVDEIAEQTGIEITTVETTETTTLRMTQGRARCNRLPLPRRRVC